MKAFLRYITRPSGFGRTEWVPAIIVHVAYLGMLIQRFWWNSVAAQFVFYFGLFLCFMFWISTWRNWKVDRKGLPTSPKFHRNDITGEGSTRPYWKATGKPIMDRVLWYAMVHECSMSEAEVAFDRHEWELSREHEHYLNSFK